MKRTIHRLPDLLMLLHTIVYLLGAIAFFSVGISSDVTFSLADHLTFLAVWSVVFLLHGREYHMGKLRQTREGMVSAADERHAYRDGFNDAVRMLRESQEIPNRLTLNEDGELIEDVEAKKRKYR